MANGVTIYTNRLYYDLILRAFGLGLLLLDRITAL